MRPSLDHGLEERGGGWTNPLAGGDHPGGTPLAVAPMGAGHVVGNGGVTPPGRRAGVAGGTVGAAGVLGVAAAAWEDLALLVVDAPTAELPDEPIRHGIPVSVDLDVIVRADPASLPAGESVSLIRRGCATNASHPAMDSGASFPWRSSQLSK